jgi:large subunit ribosomal protein L9
MEIILKQDMKGLGYENDIVTVKNGYARNYLIPKGYAIVADAQSKKILAEVLKQKSHKEAKNVEAAEAQAKALEGITVKIAAKASESGKIYGSVNDIQIAQAIQDQYKYEVDRKKISIDNSIKEIGTYTAVINLYKGIKATINFEVFAE